MKLLCGISFLIIALSYACKPAVDNSAVASATDANCVQVEAEFKQLEAKMKGNPIDLQAEKNRITKVYSNNFTIKFDSLQAFMEDPSPANLSSAQAHCNSYAVSAAKANNGPIWSNHLKSCKEEIQQYSQIVEARKSLDAAKSKVESCKVQASQAVGECTNKGPEWKKGVDGVCRPYGKCKEGEYLTIYNDCASISATANGMQIQECKIGEYKTVLGTCVSQDELNRLSKQPQYQTSPNDKDEDKDGIPDNVDKCIYPGSLMLDPSQLHRSGPYVGCYQGQTINR